MGSSESNTEEPRAIKEFVDAINSGDLARVGTLLTQDPWLLFADIDYYGSPARAAADSPHHHVTDYLAREILRRIDDGNVPERDLYGAIHDLGEVAHAETGYPMSHQLQELAEPSVVRFLTHGNESLRYIAVNVLGLHWGLRRHRETFVSMMFKDPDDDVRRLSTACLGSVLRETRDWEATKTLLRKFKDLNEKDSVREEAYESLLQIWREFGAHHRNWVEVTEARKPLEGESNEAGERGDWGLASDLWERAGRVWESHIDRDFISKLERGEEP